MYCSALICHLSQPHCCHQPFSPLPPLPWQDVAAVEDARQKLLHKAEQRGLPLDLPSDFVFVQQMRAARQNATRA